MRIKSFVFWLVLNSSWKIVLCDFENRQNTENNPKPPLRSTYSASDLNSNKNNEGFENPQNTDIKPPESSRSTYPSNDLNTIPNNDVLYETCSLYDFSCLAIAANDRLGLEAIKALHQKLDDDANGNIDLSESDDFLREELKYNSGYEKRQQVFHKNDMQISVKELWETWLKSDVHNWTIQQTSDWLSLNVELPQYVSNFIEHKVTGANLPRLAANNAHYLSSIGIKDPIHKQKIALKAMDVVLFGPPKDGHHWKDLTLIFLTIVGGLGIYYAFQQNKNFRSHLNRMNRDMDSLQNAEKALENLQKELEEAKQAQESVITEKANLEKKLQDSKGDFSSLTTSYSDLEVSQLKAEIEMLRTELQIAEGELKDRCWSPPLGLQQWLQLTHEIENKSYIKKKINAEKQLTQARDACEKLRKKRSSLVGAFVSTHGKSIDEVDRSIVEARTALNEVTQELQERVHRWKQIEMLCGFNIINNHGLSFLENQLYRNANGRAALKSRMNSTDDLNDEYGQPGYIEASQQLWKEGDSSGSEASKQEDDSHSSTATPSSVHFLVGGESSTTPTEEPNQSAIPKLSKLAGNPRSVSNNSINATFTSISPKPIMSRSQSHDTNMTLDLAVKPKSSVSETAIKPKTIDEDVCSTDSSLMEDESKKKKRKLFNFSKKSKKGDV